MISKEALLKDAKQYHYKPEILEKVYWLLETLQQIAQVPRLRDKLVLKGGTALNLFHFDNVPRLSVDIDLNYVGQINRAAMIQERPMINTAIKQILSQNKLELYRNPKNYSGGKMIWRYSSVLGQKGNLEIDLNYMYRKPLWPVQLLSPTFNKDKDNDFKFPVLDLHELAAGKLSALFNRTASRDLYDAHHLLTKCQLDNEKLRLTFVVYISMTQKELSSLMIESIIPDERDVHNRLIPVMMQENIPKNRTTIKAWANTLAQELKEALKQILPLRQNEIDFILKMREQNKIDPTILTDDIHLQNIITEHPALLWAIKRNDITT